MNDTDIAWAAGFIDGEGCIAIRKRNGKGDKGYVLSLTATQVDALPLLKLSKIFGGAVGGPYGSQSGRFYHTWTIVGKRAFDALVFMEPYLTTKSDEAHVGMLFQMLLPGVGSGRQSDIFYDQQRAFKKRLEDIKDTKKSKTIIHALRESAIL